MIKLISKKEFYTHIYLDYAKVEFLYCIKNNNNNKERKFIQ